MKLLALLCALMLLVPAGACAAGAWLPFWDASAALEEAAVLAPQLDSVCAFAAFFNEEDKVILTGGAASLLMDLQVTYAGTDTQVYLSVANDRHTRTGIEGKSTALLRRLLADDKAIARHIDDLIMLVDSTRTEALEIDYENLGDDRQLWQQFTLFITELHAQLERDGISLRVVLPWDAPRYATLPEGPVYSVMCYNLYGTHSGPGPKADFAFLDEIVSLYAGMPGTVRMAFATGGFDWSDAGVESLTQQQAENRLSLYGVTPTRDAASGALTAEYTADGIVHTIWYADGETLSAWQGHAAGFAGYDLFRLGGNNVADLFTTTNTKENAP